MSELSAEATTEKIRVFQEFKGALTEQYVRQELYVNPSIRNVYYWTSDVSAEVDFVIAEDSLVIPIEVKGGESLQAKSLKVFRDKYKTKLAIRTSLSNLSYDAGLLNIPLYVLWNLENYKSLI